MTQRGMLVSNGTGACSSRSPSSTTVRVCEMRTELRTMASVERRSESSKASFVMASASAESAGSNMGTRANDAYTRLSCSFCEENIPGSSAASMTRPPEQPARAMLMSGSAATFTPTCFIVTRARLPAMDRPRAASRATFSFTDHSAYVPGSFENASSVSVDGVPG